MTEIKIGLIGKLRSGKNTLADYATSRHRFRQFAFGDALKDRYHDTFPWIPRSPKPRDGYQKWGQLIRREFDEDVWVKQCMNAILNYLNRERIDADLFGSPLPKVIVTDVRQPNEVTHLKENGFVLIRVNAPDSIRLERAREAGDSFDEESLRHETELYIDKYSVDYDLENVGTVASMCKEFDEILKELGVNE